MSYKIIWSPKSYDDLKGIDAETARRIIKRTNELNLAPYHFVEKITDQDCWKLRVGDYRLLLDIEEAKKEIMVLKVGQGRNIYK